MKNATIEVRKVEDIHSPLGKEIFRLRRKVFIEEQQVAEEEEFDEFEEQATHLAAMYEGRVVGTARWRTTAKGIKLERFAVLMEYRGQGVGDSLMKKALREFQSYEGRIYLHAQVDAIPFYEKHQFVKIGEQFEECNIQHVVMIHENKKQMERIEITLARAIEHVRHFHDAFGIGNEDRPKAQIRENDYRLRHRLMKEENEEYLAAAEKGDLVEIADALGDMLYILCGTILKHGLQEQFSEIFEEIQRSNMSKLDRDGKPIYREDGKVLKSDRYFKPDISKILRNYI